MSHKQKHAVKQRHVEQPVKKPTIRLIKESKTAKPVELSQKTTTGDYSQSLLAAHKNPPQRKIEEPVAAEPIAAEPIASEPITSEPVASEPVAAAEPVVAEPVAMEPVPEPSPEPAPEPVKAISEVLQEPLVLPETPAKISLRAPEPVIPARHPNHLISLPFGLGARVSLRWKQATGAGGGTSSR